MKHWKIGEEAFFWALQNRCAIHRKPYSPDLARQQLAAPHSVTSFLAAAAEFGFEADLRKCKLPRLHRQAFPLVAWLAPKSVPVDTASPGQKRASVPVLLLQADAGQVLVIECGEALPATLPITSFAARFLGYVSRVTPVSDPAVDPDSEAQAREARKFGFSSFVPELLKHKKLWQEVLLASLVTQLIALHSGNRVDAVLGASVFERLFKLPPMYFQHRPTGVIAARLHGVDTIREFIAGAAVTLILDFPFLLIFVGIMFYYSVTLTLIMLALIGVIAILGLFVAPLFQTRLQEQFLLGAKAL